MANFKLFLIILFQFLVEGPLCAFQAEIQQSGTDAEPMDPSSLLPLQEIKKL